jgi:AhpD family alkylhydroperoxidase
MTTDAHVLQPRIDPTKYQDAYRVLAGFEQYLHHSGIEKSLLHLLKMRASQINGCAYCIDMHSKDARAAGETEQRLYGLSAWRETPFYTDRERAALEWLEALTLISTNDVPDALYDRVRQHFSEPELVAVTMAAIAINSWNRVAIPFRAVPGSYEVKTSAAAKH